MYCNAVREGLSHGHTTGNMHKKFGKVQPCGFWVMQADRQRQTRETDRQNRHAHHNTLHHSQGWSNDHL